MHQTLRTISHRTLLLLCVGLFFYATYGLTNWFTSQRENVPEIIFDWEYSIPFVPWTIVPYWSLNLLYALAFYLCRHKAELHRYVLHLVVAQSIAIIAFLCFPLQMSWQKPMTEGIFEPLFASLATFDQPYNQAPSLHIILTIIVGAFYWRYLSSIWRVPLIIWLGLIAISILTTYQHHFIDLPTGAFVGYSILWALPYSDKKLHKDQQSFVPKRYRLAIYYLLAGIAVSTIALLFQDTWLWLLWLAIALFLVAYAYLYAGVRVFQKNRYGKLSTPAYLLLLPYLVSVRLNIFFWLYGKQKSVAINNQLFIGSLTEAKHFPAVVDLSAEYPCAYSGKYRIFPNLDLIAPTPSTLIAAVITIEDWRKQGEKVLVCCALGYGRSAAAILVWLVVFGGCSNLTAAIEQLKMLRPEFVLPNDTKQAVAQAITSLQNLQKKEQNPPLANPRKGVHYG